MKPAKICIECSAAFIPPAHVKKPKARCVECHRVHGRKEMAELRRKRKLVMIAQSDHAADRKVCTKCLELKRLSEFSPRKNKRSGELCKLCDACLTYIYTSKSCVTNGFCAVWWRKRAYTMNTVHRNALAMDKGVKYSTIQLKDIDYIVKPQVLAAIYDQQKGLCSYCSMVLDPSNTSVDHAQPRSKGGAHRPENFRVTCGDCNRLKHTKSEVEFRSFVIDYAKRFQVTERPDKEPVG